jgi:hypothetical protein
MDVVEVCPPLDHADVTSHLAAYLLFEGLALAALAAPGGACGGEVTGSSRSPAARRAPTLAVLR